MLVKLADNKLCSATREAETNSEKSAISHEFVFCKYRTQSIQHRYFLQIEVNTTIYKVAMMARFDTRLLLYKRIIYVLPICSRNRLSRILQHICSFDRLIARESTGGKKSRHSRLCIDKFKTIIQHYKQHKSPTF